MHLAATLYCLKKICGYRYSFIVRRSYLNKYFLFKFSNSYSKMVWIMFRGKSKDIGTTPTSSVSLVDFEQVNVCWDVIKSLLNDFWSILKMLCSKCCLCLSYFYWHNALIYSLLNQNAGENLISSETKLCR